MYYTYMQYPFWYILVCNWMYTCMHIYMYMIWRNIPGLCIHYYEFESSFRLQSHANMTTVTPSVTYERAAACQSSGWAGQQCMIGWLLLPSFLHRSSVIVLRSFEVPFDAGSRDARLITPTRRICAHYIHSLRHPRDAFTAAPDFLSSTAQLDVVTSPTCRVFAACRFEAGYCSWVNCVASLGIEK